VRVIRSSEIGTFLYCQRAWWYANQGLPSSNQNEMASGTRAHQQHGQQVFTIRLMRLAGWLLLLCGVGLVTLALALSWVQ
jgi:hypothetical protein